MLPYECDNGRLLVVDATLITAIRTAAVSGPATRLLARPDAGDLALIGAGVQAATHLQALDAVPPLRRVRVYSCNPAHAAPFAALQAERHGPARQELG